MDYNVLDHGKVELVDFMGSDLKIVNMARGSFGKRHEEIEEGDDKLIHFLMKNRHGTPFEHCYFTFHIKCPISVAREWFRHRIASYSEISGRYVQLEEEFYIPEGDAIRTQTGKPGNYKFEPVSEKNWKRLSILFKMDKIYKQMYIAYKQLIEDGLAKEVARNILGVGIYTQFYFTVNARSLMNFLNLRNNEHAMLEIQKYAIILEKIFAEKLPITYEAFIKNERIAP